jgi:hypothetical protein
MLGKEMFKADTLKDVYAALHPHRIDTAQVAETLSEAGSAFDGNRWIERLAINLNEGPKAGNTFVLTGHSRLEISVGVDLIFQRLQHTFTILRISVIEELNLSSFTYIDLILLILEKLLALGEGYGIHYDQPIAGELPAWEQNPTIPPKRESRKSDPLDDTDEEDDPGLLESLISTREAAKHSFPLRQMMKHSMEPKVPQLISFCNLLISQIESAMPSEGQKRLFILVQDLDEAPFDRVQGLFFPHAPMIASLACRVVYTIPGLFYYHPNYNRVRAFFRGHWEVPAIQIHDLEDVACQTGLQCLRKIVLSGMEEALFATSELSDRLIHASGGCLRDLLLLVVNAADEALDRGSQTIEASDCEKVIELLKKEYATIFAEIMNASGQSIDLYEVLTQGEDPSLRITMLENHAAHGLRQNHCLLNLGNDNMLIHPLVQALLAERGGLNKKVDST